MFNSTLLSVTSRDASLGEVFGSLAGDYGSRLPGRDLLALNLCKMNAVSSQEGKPERIIIKIILEYLKTCFC